MKKLAFSTTAVALFATPLFAFASGEALRNFVQFIGDILNMLIPILIAAALVAFFWGLVKYIWSGGGEGAEDGKKVMIAGIVALFVMVSVWGIIRLAQNTLGVPDVNYIPAPQAPK